MVSIIYDLPVSFLNASIGISSANSTVCISNITSLNTSISLLVQQIRLGVFDKMGSTLRRMTQTVHPICFACYYSGFEYYGILLDYFYTIIDVNKLVYNLAHNLGTIYDAVTNLIAIFRFESPKVRDYWQKIGYNFGLILNQVAYKPTNYNPYVKPATPK